MKPNKHKKI